MIRCVTTRTRVSMLLVWLLVWAASAHPLAAGDASSGRYKGLALAAALTRLQLSGLKLLFSSDLVQPHMIVADEPRGRWPRELLDELLAPHGLQAKRGPAGTLLIVKAPLPLATAGSGRIEGTVRLAGARRPIAGVQILGTTTGVSATSDADGAFEMGALPEGRYVIEVRRAGYLPQRVEQVPVTAGSVTHLRLELHPRHVHVEEIVVRAVASSAQASVPAVREALTRHDLDTSPDFADDAFLPVSRLTGVAAGAGSSGLHLRGGARREAKIVLDGLELYEPYHLKDRGGPIGLIDSSTLGEVGVLNGAFPAEYGGHMGAVLEMDTIVPSRSLGGSVGWSLDDQRLVTQGSSGERVRWLVSGRRGDPSLLLDALGADPNYQPTYWDAYAKADYQIDNRSTLSLHVLGGADEVEGDAIDETFVTVQEPGRFRSQHTNGYAWLTLARSWTPALYTQTVLSHGSLRSSRFGSAPEVSEVQDARSVQTFGVKQDWLLQSSRHLFKWGVDLRRLRASYDYRSTPALLPRTQPALPAPAASPITIMSTPTGSDIGVYLADRLRVRPRLHVELGLRWDLQTYTPGQGGSLGPRVNAVYALGERTSLRLGWGYFSQPQKIHELQVEDGVSHFLPAERAEHRVVSFAHELAHDLRIQVNAYQKLVTDVNPRFENLFDPFGFFPEADGDRVRIAPSAARAEGAELSVRRHATRVGWWAGYSLARSEDRIDGRWVPRSWDQRHTLNAGIDWKPRDLWNVTLAAGMQSGRPTTPVSAVMDVLADGSSTVVPIVGARNSERLPTYSRVDLQVSRTIPIRRSALRAGLVVTDVFNRANVCCVSDFAFTPQSDGTASVERSLRYDLSRLIRLELAWRF